MKRLICLLVLFVLMMVPFTDSYADAENPSEIVDFLKTTLIPEDGISYDVYYDSNVKCYNIVMLLDAPLVLAQYANQFDFIKTEYTELHKSLFESYKAFKELIQMLGSYKSVAVSVAQVGVPSKTRNYTIVMTIKNGIDIYDYAGIYCDSVLDVEENDSYSGQYASKIFPPGEWECPRNINAGAYSVTCADSVAHIAVYRNGIAIYNEALIRENGDSVGRMVLKAGDVVKISNGELCFTALSE